nr:MAG TPA: hypothetical protein [Caudoviricetes sp.]
MFHFFLLSIILLLQVRSIYFNFKFFMFKFIFYIKVI